MPRDHHCAADLTNDVHMASKQTEDGDDQHQE
jgi:hypothetical protein